MLLCLSFCASIFLKSKVKNSLYNIPRLVTPMYELAESKEYLNLLSFLVRQVDDFRLGYVSGLVKVLVLLGLTLFRYMLADANMKSRNSRSVARSVIISPSIVDL